jgi:hypothetical protein
VPWISAFFASKQPIPCVDDPSDIRVDTAAVFSPFLSVQGIQHESYQLEFPE